MPLHIYHTCHIGLSQKHKKLFYYRFYMKSVLPCFGLVKEKKRKKLIERELRVNLRFSVFWVVWISKLTWKDSLVTVTLSCTCFCDYISFYFTFYHLYSILFYLACNLFLVFKLEFPFGRSIPVCSCPIDDNTDVKMLVTYSHYYTNEKEHRLGQIHHVCCYFMLFVSNTRIFSTSPQGVCTNWKVFSFHLHPCSGKLLQVHEVYYWLFHKFWKYDY